MSNSSSCNLPTIHLGVGREKIEIEKKDIEILCCAEMRLMNAEKKRVFDR